MFQTQLAACLIGLSLTFCAAANPQTANPPATRKIMSLDDVRIGMKGYGLTVFQGTKIEPFPVEVISVMRNFFLGLQSAGAKRGMIWIRCTSERMRKYGAVKGMSGSPIYLWDENEPHELGRGGKLIGAFALGFNASKDCYVGVQPIEQMRAVGSRATRSDDDVGTATPQSHRGLSASTTLVILRSAAEQLGMQQHQTWRLEALTKLVNQNVTHDAAIGSVQTPQTVRLPKGIEGEALPLLLPVAISSAKAAQVLAPLFARIGMAPLAANAVMTMTKPPAWIEPDKIRLQPGSVLTVPIAFGDIEIGGSGTVTEILPDGTVLAFGHHMEAVGPTAIPMGTGYVHFVLPHLAMSFKLASSARIRGALVRDEFSAVAGRPDASVETASINIVADFPDQQTQTYHNEVLRNKTYLPIYTALVAAESIFASRIMPRENTFRLRSEMIFDGDRNLAIDRFVPFGSYMSIVSELLPVLAVLAGNEYEPVLLQSMKLTSEAEESVKLGWIVDARLDRDELPPGTKLGVNLRLQQYGGATYDKRIVFTIPKSTPDGNYEMNVGDANNYVTRMLANRPHLLAITNVDELFETLQMITSVKDNALYGMMNLPDKGLAIGRDELPTLPSSRRTLIAAPLNTVAKPYKRWITQSWPMDQIIQGNLKFNILIDKSLAER